MRLIKNFPLAIVVQQTIEHPKVINCEQTDKNYKFINILT